MENLDLVATVKSSSVSGDNVECDAFVMCRESLTSRKIFQYRDNMQCGTWEVLAHTKSVLVLKRIDGDQELVEVDALYVEHQEPIVQPAAAAPQKVLTFEGKNWKLASEKKWKEAYVTGASSDVVGEATLRGKLHEIRKSESGFIAIPKVA